MEKIIIIIIASRAFSKIPGEVQFQVIYQLPGEVQVGYQEKGAMGHPSQTLGLGFGSPVWSQGLDMMVLVGSCQRGVFYQR